LIPKECKRLAEVDFPIAVVSSHAAREKSIRHGHPSTLHLWWARRPLASCRAMLLALLLPDPCDPHCPTEFKAKARSILKEMTGVPPGDDGLRKALLGFIGDVANWDVANHSRWIGIARDLVKAAHPEETPLVVDPFAGGGSIPLEALRLGCDAFASDLNPVACLINKVLLEDIPRRGPELADELRRVGAEVKAAAEKELAEFYPVDPDGARPIAYLWARTVRCESPNCGAEIPLVRSFWLSKKASRRRALKPVVVRPKGDVPRVEFEIFEPKSERDVSGGTVSRARATCPCCNMVLGPDRVRAQLAAQRGGADVLFPSRDRQGAVRIGGARLLAVVTLRDGHQGRSYRLPTDADYQAVWRAQRRLKQIEHEKRPDGLSPIPDEPTPAGGGSGAGRAFSVQKYGMLQWGDLFTARQMVAILTMAYMNASTLGDQAIPRLLALSIGQNITRNCTLCRWRSQADQEKVENAFARQALPIVWDFAEAVPTSGVTGSVDDSIVGVRLVVDSVSKYSQSVGSVDCLDATALTLPTEGGSVWFTDPPYYDAIPYADLSDFFLIWLKRTLPGHSLPRDPFDPSNPLSPKLQEAVQDETKQFNGKPKDRRFFEDTMAKAFAEGRRVLREDGIGSVVFAHKTTEGWEALLSGMIRGGWTITGSWPISTEMATRLRARDSAALATSPCLG
jgi:adenine-specific DNA methylase